MATGRDDTEVSEADFIDQQVGVDDDDEATQDVGSEAPILVDEVDWREQQVEVPLEDDEAQ